MVKLPNLRYNPGVEGSKQKEFLELPEEKAEALLKYEAENSCQTHNPPKGWKVDLRGGIARVIKKKPKVEAEEADATSD